MDDFVLRDHLFLPNHPDLRSDVASTVGRSALDRSVDASAVQGVGHLGDHCEARCQERGRDFHPSASVDGRASRDERRET
jgi:hypothetical protein